jgi:type I restriction enzyme S subunit
MNALTGRWRSTRLRFLADLRSGFGITSADIEESGEYPVYGGNGVRGFTDRYTHDGDHVLIGRQGALCGNVHRASGKFWASEHAVVATMRSNAAASWYAYLVDSMNLGQYSVAAAQPGLAVDRIKELRVALPPSPTQRAIANFLDRKTAAIDRLIAAKERLIALLVEKRQALITRAVTRGLDPNVPLKDSGIPWLGKIPEHWDVVRARFLYRQMNRSPTVDDGIVTAYRDGEVTLREKRRADGYTFAIKEAGYQRIEVGDLVIHSMDAFAGAIGVSDSIGKCTPEYVVCTPLDGDFNNHYYAAALRLMAKQDYVYVICPSVRERAPRFRYARFKDVWLPVPPTAEQDDIAKEISRIPSVISSVSQALAEQVDRMREYRQTLISAAVTGKIDVREDGGEEVAV